MDFVLDKLKDGFNWVDKNPVEAGLTALSVLPGGRAAGKAVKYGPKFGIDAFAGAKSQADSAADAVRRKRDLIRKMRIRGDGSFESARIPEDPTRVDEFVKKTIPDLTRGTNEGFETTFPGIRVEPVDLSKSNARWYGHQGDVTGTKELGRYIDFSHDPKRFNVWNVIDETGTFDQASRNAGLKGTIGSFMHGYDGQFGNLDEAFLIPGARGSAISGLHGNLMDQITSARLALIRGLSEGGRPVTWSNANAQSAFPMMRSTAVDEMRPFPQLAGDFRSKLVQSINSRASYLDPNNPLTDDVGDVMRQLRPGPEDELLEEMDPISMRRLIQKALEVRAMMPTGYGG